MSIKMLLMSQGISVSQETLEFLGIEANKLIDPQGVAYDRFGVSISLNSDSTVAAIGAPNLDGDQGGVFIFSRSGDTWSFEAKLKASDAALRANGTFGNAISIDGSGTRLVVGSRNHNEKATGSGAAYIFEKVDGSWIQKNKIVLTVTTDSQQFGYAVAISRDGQTIAIGRPGYNPSAAVLNTGAIQTYYRDANGVWQYMNFTPQQYAARNSYFGCSVSLSEDGSVMAGGAYQYDLYSGDSGIAETFIRSGNTWTTQGAIRPSDLTASEWYGYVVSISDDGLSLAVSSVLNKAKGTNSGAVYFYSRASKTSAWTQRQKITAFDGAAEDRFGVWAALSGDGQTLVSGSNWNNNANGTKAGGLYVYERTGNTFVLKDKYLASDGANDDQFGVRFGINQTGNRILVGAPNLASFRGAVYDFK